MMNMSVLRMKQAAAFGWVLVCLSASATTYEDGTVTERVVIPEGERLTVSDPHDVTFAGGISMTNATLTIDSTDVRPLVFSLDEDSATATNIVQKTSLDSITNFSAQITGSSLSGVFDTLPCFVKREGNTLTCQFQYSNGTTLRCGIVEFAQSGNDVTARVLKRPYLSDKTKQPGDVDMSVTYTGNNTRTQIYLVNLTVFCSELTYNKDDRLVLDGPTDATNAMLEVSGTFNAPKTLELVAAKSMPASGAVYVGAYGTLSMNATVSGISGITRGTRINVSTNGCLLVKQAYSLSARDSYVVIDGGVMLMRPDSTGDDSGGYVYDLTLKNGARLTGAAPRFRRQGSGAYLRAKGTTPSFVDTGLIVWSYDPSTAGKLTLDVENVTGDAETDLTIAKLLRVTTNADYTNVKVIKTGEGTVRLDSGWNLPQVLQIQAGTWLQGTNGTTDVGLSLEGGSFAVAAGTTNEVGVLTVTASGKLSVAANAKLSFAASNAEQWAADVVVTVEGDLTSDTLRFGTDAGGLTRPQLSKMLYGDKRVMLDANGYLREYRIPGLSVILR